MSHKFCTVLCVPETLPCLARAMIWVSATRNGSTLLRSCLSAACTGLFTADFPKCAQAPAPVRRGDGDLAALGKEAEGRLDILCGLCKIFCFAVTLFSVAPIS